MQFDGFSFAVIRPNEEFNLYWICFGLIIERVGVPMIVSNAPHCGRDNLFQNFFFHFQAAFELLKYSMGFCVS